MADIVLGIGSSHTPQLNIPGNLWGLLEEKDRHDPRMQYEALREKAPLGLEAELGEAAWGKKYQLCLDSLARLQQELMQARPDVIVMLGDDQHEQFLDDNLPMFCIYWGEELLVTKPVRKDPSLGDMSTLKWKQVEETVFPEKPGTYPGHPTLAHHLIDYLKRQQVDVASSNRLKEDIGLGHAFSFLYRRILPEGVVIPMVPVMINTFYPPNQPTPKRCYQIGRLVAEAIRAWTEPARVAIMASGGLSHVIINEALDRQVIQAMLEKNPGALEALPEDQLNLGTSETRCWIAAAGALEALPMTLLSYQACYRSMAGTGCGMTFAFWK